MGIGNHGHSRKDGNPMILTEPSGMILPRERAFTPLANGTFPIGGA